MKAIIENKLKMQAGMHGYLYHLNYDKLYKVVKMYKESFFSILQRLQP